MIIALFVLVLALILFNWLYKKDDKIKPIIKHFLNFAIFAVSIVTLALGNLKLVHILFCAYLILSSATKLVLNKDVVGRFIKGEETRAKCFTYSDKITLALYYIDLIFHPFDAEGNCCVR